MQRINNNNTKGMTLIEVMVAIIILAIFTLGSASLVTLINHNTDVSRQHYQAIGLAKNRIERARVLNFHSIEQLEEPPPGTRIDRYGYPDPDGIFQRQTHISTVTNGLKEITVNLFLLNRKTYRFEGKAQTLQSYIVNMISPSD